VILDTHLRTPITSRIFDTSDPVIIFHGSEVDPHRVELLSAKALLLAAPSTGDPIFWDQVLSQLGKRKITSLLIEGGAEVAASAIRGGYVDRIFFFYSSKIIGSSGISSVGDLGIERLETCPLATEIRVRRFGPDFVVEGRMRPRKQPLPR
jgi:diaminohydroxyphosphoribosylaminopyrimidine deaminase/5-amino-6-(5-phosphoribosylamino)uracil reductase